MMSGSSSPMPEQVVMTHVVGIDIGMESCTMSCLTLDKRQVIKSTPFANTLQGCDWLFERLEGLGVAAKEMVVGLACSESGPPIPTGAKLSCIQRRDTAAVLVP